MPSVPVFVLLRNRIHTFVPLTAVVQFKGSLETRLV
jgi:hypothetical protein